MWITIKDYIINFDHIKMIKKGKDPYDPVLILYFCGSETAQIISFKNEDERDDTVMNIEEISAKNKKI